MLGHYNLYGPLGAGAGGAGNHQTPLLGEAAINLGDEEGLPFHRSGGDDTLIKDRLRVRASA